MVEGVGGGWPRLIRGRKGDGEADVSAWLSSFHPAQVLAPGMVLPTQDALVTFAQLHLSESTSRDMPGGASLTCL